MFDLWSGYINISFGVILVIGLLVASALNLGRSYAVFHLVAAANKENSTCHVVLVRFTRPAA